MEQNNPSTTQPTSSTAATTPPEKKSKTGCVLFGALGCLWLFVVIALAGVGIGYYFYQEYQDDLYWNNYYNNYDWNYNYNYNDNYNYNYNSDDYFNDNVNDDVNGSSETNSDTFTNSTVTEDGEIIAEDGTSLGFESDPIDEDLYAYQAGAYSNQHFTGTDWSAVRITLDYPKVAPMTDAADDGSLWVGVSLDNDYFVQVGMNSSTETDANGNMRWNYFWQMWDDQDNYKYGLQEPLENYGWHNKLKTLFLP
jgi:hypothetical protein